MIGCRQSVVPLGTSKRTAAFGGSTIAAVRFFFFVLALLTAATPAKAQFIGFTSLQTEQQTLFPAGTACTGASQTAIINNLGQTSHSLYLTAGGVTMTSVQYFLEGSNDGVTYTRISDETDGNVNGNLSASGYFTVVRANITCLPAATANFTLTYSGFGVPPSQPQGDGLRAQIEKSLAFNTNAGADQNGNFRTPYGNLVGLLKVNVGTAAGSPTLTITCQFNILAFNSVQTFNLVTGINSIAIPATPCAVATWSYSHGTSSGTFSLEYVFSAGFSGGAGTAGSGGSTTAGCVADGVSLTGCNPLSVGGKTSPGSSSPGVAKFATVLGENVNDLSAGNYNVLGWAIGAGNLSGINNFTAVTAPNVGPLTVQIYGQRADTASTLSTNTSTTASNGAPGVTTAGTASSSLNGLLVNNNGFSTLTASQTINANGSQNVTGPGWNFGAFDSCYVTVTTGNPTGTTPTLDVHFQSSTDGTNFTDRIHFTQITTTASTQKQVAGIVSGTAGFVPQAISNGQELAQTTILNGPVGAWLRFQWVIGGTTPSYPTVQFGVVCH